MTDTATATPARLGATAAWAIERAIAFAASHPHQEVVIAYDNRHHGGGLGRVFEALVRLLDPDGYNVRLLPPVLRFDNGATVIIRDTYANGRGVLGTHPTLAITVGPIPAVALRAIHETVRWDLDDAAVDDGIATTASATPEAPSTGLDRIAGERRRQVEVEGWTPEHDDAHAAGELAAAGYCYAAVAAFQHQGLGDMAKERPAAWPWEPEWWKPSDDPARNLEKAGALMAAELDRAARA